jgi:hypothetical protein
MMTFSQAIAASEVSTEDALAIFDGLEPVGIEFMMGEWMGSGFPTGHKLDGLLETYHWYGKRFESQEDVHPLVFTTLRGRKTSVNPILMMPWVGVFDFLPFLKSGFMGRVFQFLLPIFSTRRSRARLRLMSYRGKVSAAMIYDHSPINDIFHKVDENTVLGLMDLKGIKQPFFFVLRREQGRG